MPHQSFHCVNGLAHPLTSPLTVRAVFRQPTRADKQAHRASERVGRCHLGGCTALPSARLLQAFPSPLIPSSFQEQAHEARGRPCKVRAVTAGRDPTQTHSTTCKRGRCRFVIQTRYTYRLQHARHAPMVHAPDFRHATDTHTRTLWYTYAECAGCTYAHAANTRSLHTHARCIHTHAANARTLLIYARCSCAHAVRLRRLQIRTR